MDLGAMFTGLLALIPKLFYLLTMSILSVVDVFQMLMRKLAGLDCYYVDGNMETGDIVSDFLTGILFGGYPILSNVFFGLIILAGILLFLSTIIAIIRNEYTTEKADNSKAKIIGKAFKSVIYVAIIPVVCVFGMYLANVVLVAVDSATTYNTNYGSTLDKTKLQAVDVSTQTFGNGTPKKTYITYNLFGITDEDGLPYGTTNTTFSGTIFKAAAYGANRIRVTSGNPDETNFGYLIKNGQVTDFGGLFTDANGNAEAIAQKIDIAFGDNVVFAVDVQGTLDTTSSPYITELNNHAWDPFGDPSGKTYTWANKFDVQLVWYYYDLWSFNYVIGLGAAIILTTIFVNIIFGLMRRLVELVGLFLMAPPLIALMPLDNEKAYGEWRKKFLSKALMAYGAIGGMNVVMLILPELQKISFFNNTFLDLVANTLLILVAMLAVKDFIGVVSGFVGGEDANKVGEGVAKDVAGTVGKMLTTGASVAGVAAVGAGAAVKGGMLLAKGGLAAAKMAGGVGLGAARAAGKVGGAVGGAVGRIGGAAAGKIGGAVAGVAGKAGSAFGQFAGGVGSVVGGWAGSATSAIKNSAAVQTISGWASNAASVVKNTGVAQKVSGIANSAMAKASAIKQGVSDKVEDAKALWTTRSFIFTSAKNSIKNSDMVRMFKESGIPDVAAGVARGAVKVGNMTVQGAKFAAGEFKQAGKEIAEAYNEYQTKKKEYRESDDYVSPTERIKKLGTALKEQSIDIGKPMVESLKLAAKEIGGIYGNAFTSELLKDDRLKDVKARLFSGQTYADVKKAEDKEKDSNKEENNREKLATKIVQGMRSTQEEDRAKMVKQLGDVFGQKMDEALRKNRRGPNIRP